MTISLLASAFSASPISAAEASGLIAVVCDKDSCDNYGGPISAYVNQIAADVQEYADLGGVETEILSLDYAKYGVSGPDELPEELIQVVVKDLAEVLENFYRAQGLLGVILVGRVPVPDVDYQGNVFKSVYPYMDFDDKAFLYSEQQGNFVYTGADPKAEIWSGVIREAKDTNLNGFFSKALAYHAGGVEVSQRMFYENLVELEIFKKSIQDKTAEEKAEAWEGYISSKEEMIGRTGRWMTASRASDGYGEDGEQTEPFEPELGEIDLSEDVLQYFRKEIDARKNSYEVAFNIPKHIIEYLGLPPGTSPFGYTPRPTEFETLMNAVLADLEIPQIIFFCPMWGAYRMVIPSRRSQWTSCTEDGTGFPFGNYRVDLFSCTDSTAWWVLHNLVSASGANAAMVIPKKGAGTISVGTRGGEATLLDKKAVIVKPGDVIHPGAAQLIYYWDDPNGVADEYEEGFDELFEDLNGDEKYQEGEVIDKGNNEVVDILEDEDYKKTSKSSGSEDVLVIYFDDPWRTLPEDTRATGFSITGEWDPFPGIEPDLSGEEVSGGGTAAGSVEEFEFWTELFYMSWDDAEKLLAQIAVPAWGKYEEDESSFELHYLVSDYGDKYLMMAEESTDHRSDRGSDPPLFDCEFEGECSDLNDWSFFSDGDSECFKERKKLGTIVLQIAEGWRAGWLENKTPENSFGAYAIANGTNLVFLGRTVEPTKMTVAEGKIEITNDTGDVFREETGDFAGKIGPALGGQSNAMQGKLNSVLSGGGEPAVDPADDASSGFSSDPFILSFAAGMPIGEALRISGWDVARILYGDPTVSLPPLEESN
ncbi:MAG: hypothetical protein PHU71_00060 [Candidatus Gracilibacteria bacterium]|nr:hypothetical protein [Candidatus Gracilibacteria bacterium]